MKTGLNTGKDKKKGVYMVIDKGYIVTVKESLFIDFPGGLWRDHFTAPRPVFYIALEFPTNNGSFKAKDKRGRVRWLHVSNVIQVKRR